MNNHLLSRLSQHNTRLTPGEIVHLPERVQGEEEREGRNGENVEHHPSDHVPLPPQDENEGLQTINSDNEDNGNNRNSLVFRSDQID